MPDYCIELINALVAERKKQGVTQMELAKATNLTQSVIARFESKKAVPQLDTLYRIAQALHCRIEIKSNLD